MTFFKLKKKKYINFQNYIILGSFGLPNIYLRKPLLKGRIIPYRACFSHSTILATPNNLSRLNRKNAKPLIRQRLQKWNMKLCRLYPYNSSYPSEFLQIFSYYNFGDYNSPKNHSALSLYYSCYHGVCSVELKSIIPPKALFTRNTRFSKAQHPFAVKLDKNRTSAFANSFIHMTSRDWNSLPATVFSATYNLQLFKTRIHRHLQLLPSP